MNTKRTGEILVLRHPDGYTMTIPLRENGDSYTFHLQSAVECITEGYQFMSKTVTYNEKDELECKLKCYVEDLRSYVNYGNKYMMALTEKHCEQEVLDLTKKLLEEHEETLMFRVGNLVALIYHRDLDIEVTDELALQCYNYVGSI